MAKKTGSKRKKTSSQSSTSSIPNAELDVLACLWREGSLTARQIRTMMKRYRPMAHGSVVTLLNRLEERGLVAKDKGPFGKAFLFRSACKPESIYRKLTLDMVHRVFAGDVGTMVVSLFDARPPTVGELDAIQKAVNSAKRKAKKKRR